MTPTTTRLPVDPGLYEYTPRGDEWWTHVRNRTIVVRLMVDDDDGEKETWFQYRGFEYTRDALPGTFRGPLEEADE